MKQTMSDQSKNRILSKIKQALAKPVPEPFTSVKPNLQNIYTPTQQELEIEFAENFTQLSGKFSFCTNEQELANQLNHLTSSRNWNKIFCREPELKYILSLNNFKNFEHNDLNTCQVSITSCEFLVARTGSIFLSSLQKSGRNTSVYAPAHICIAFTNQLVYDIGEGLTLLQEKYINQLPSLITLASGPSRTADIEKTLVTGIHGPKEVFVFLVES
ncbi:MAG TPA: LUD domain-containing protein [Chitinophagaceae bacterium]|nr:LUD domain-containing protein [Chitinophagaceae bacterium]